MSRTRNRLLVALGVILLAGLACNFPQSTPTGPDPLLTSAALTIQAQLTQAAGGLQATFTPGGPEPTFTPTANGTPLPPGVPTPTPGTPTAETCDLAHFVEDVTIPDGSTLDAGEEFVKTWRLENVGTCIWNSSYLVVFDEGDLLGGPQSIPLTTGTAAPDQSVDVSMTLTAPQEDGSYEGYWKLRNRAGNEIRFDKGTDNRIWVKIKVGSPPEEEPDTYDFIAAASSATWITSGGGSDVTLTFGGADDDPNGVAKLKDDITLENRTQAGKTLVTHPKHNDDGRIKGTFSEYTVQADQHFKAKLGFLDDCGAGNVVFQLWYKEGGNETLLEEWEKACNGNLLFVDVDLSALEGKRVQFILVLLAAGSPQDDLAIWGSAHIE